MRIQWDSPIDDKTIVGNSLGYGLANRNLKLALAKFDAIGDDEDTVISFCHPWHYKPPRGKRLAIFTMCEHKWLTDDYLKAFEVADFIVTPSNFCKEVFASRTKKPIFVCPLGIDPQVFKFRKRYWTPKRGERFRILYVGAPNFRKFSIMEEVHMNLLAPLGDKVELYVKTTGATMDGLEADVVRKGNWVVDNRMLPLDQLVKLYHSAHAGLFLHLGEGAGLVEMESMSTGLPTILSDHTATQDFATEANSFPVRVAPGKIDVLVGENLDEILRIDAGIPVLENAMERIWEVMSAYPEALVKARQGSRDVAHLTWENSARTLLKIVSDFA
jgi:glycosyltransferase involved in cell wall biosynthesis